MDSGVAGTCVVSGDCSLGDSVDTAGAGVCAAVAAVVDDCDVHPAIKTMAMHAKARKIKEFLLYILSDLLPIL
jgi:hypothetical protein